MGHELASHFFRTEYGKLVAVITRYLGSSKVETAEDIVQETLLKATQHWEMKGIPENPKAWLYVTAKNMALNSLKRTNVHRDFLSKSQGNKENTSDFVISDELISDSQLRMMFACCHESIPEHSQIALILKILSGFSIAEIADAFFSNHETINKRLVRGRKQLRKVNLELLDRSLLNQRVNAVLKTIFLLFNEGYFPSIKEQAIRFDLCLEAIRLAKLLEESPLIEDKSELTALLALMYFNVSRFESRISDSGELVDLKDQDRTKWDRQSIQTGIQYLNQLSQRKLVSKYAILATISANHCVATSYDATNWNEILSLYDELLQLENSPIIVLNRSVALAEAQGAQRAIEVLEQLKQTSDIGNYYLYHFTLAELYVKTKQWTEADKAYHKSLEMAKNRRDRILLEKKIKFLVPYLPS
nr:sigma-70 family RNA polymerase sigma factor [Allomuricauda sp.]